MSVNYSVYVGAYLKCTAKKESLVYFWDIMWEELRTVAEEIFSDGKATYYLIPNVKVNGISRKTRFSQYQDNLEIVPFNYLTVESEVHEFSIQFAGKIKELSKECESCRVEFGIIPDYS